MDTLEYFNSIAEQWNVIRSKYFNDELRNIIFSNADISGKVCADLGCGTGFISLELANSAEMVFAIDISRNMLKELYSSTKIKNIKNLYPIKGCMTDIPLFDESVDVVFTNMALHHVDDAPAAVKEMFRILKTGGTVIISDVEEHNGTWAKEEMHDSWLGFSHRQITEWLMKAGFSGIEVNTTNLKCKGYSCKGEHTETAIFIAKGIKLAE